MNTRYILFFVTTMTVVVALALTGFREATKEKAAQNEAIFNKRAILSAVDNYLGMGEGVTANSLTDEQVLDIFQNRITQHVLNAEGGMIDGVKAEDVDMAKERKKPVDERRLPLFVYEYDGQTFYIVSVRGNGLWDEIWGNIALESDVNTIAGASFDHKGETPGLGAEIKDNPAFPRQFIGTKIFEDGKFVSVTVRKGGARDETHEVDGISGATITSDGVTDMLYNGLELYLPYLESIKDEKGAGMETMLVE